MDLGAPTIEVIVSHNDTLDRIFRRLKLDLADLASLRSLPGPQERARQAAARRSAPPHSSRRLAVRLRAPIEPERDTESSARRRGLQLERAGESARDARAHGSRRHRQLSVRGGREGRRARSDRARARPRSSAGTSTSCSTSSPAIPSSSRMTRSRRTAQYIKDGPITAALVRQSGPRVSRGALRRSLRRRALLHARRPEHAARIPAHAGAVHAHQLALQSEPPPSRY